MTDILVVFTGGTIGSKRSGSVMDVDPETGYELLRMYEAGRGDEGAKGGVRFETVQPYQTLSENMNPGHWHALIDCVRAAVASDRYQGIIVTHGSDTLPYTAALLGYAFADVRVPIVLVAANHPLDDPRSNGLRNFAAAVDFVAAALPGVYAVFDDAVGGMRVYLGTRMMEAAPFTDRFEPPYGAPLGHIAEGRFVPLAHEVNPPLEALRAPREPGLPPDKLGFATDVLYIRPYPGLDYGLYDFGAAGRRKPAAVLHGLHHSATACSDEADGYAASIAAFAAHCAEHGVDLYTAPAKAASAARYRSADEIAAAGSVRGLPYIAPEAALMKLIAAYGTYPGEAGRAARDAFLARNVYFEHHEGGRW